MLELLGGLLRHHQWPRYPQEGPGSSETIGEECPSRLPPAVKPAVKSKRTERALTVGVQVNLIDHYPPANFEPHLTHLAQFLWGDKAQERKCRLQVSPRFVQANPPTFPAQGGWVDLVLTLASLRSLEMVHQS